MTSLTPIPMMDEVMKTPEDIQDHIPKASK